MKEDCISCDTEWLGGSLSAEISAKNSRITWWIDGKTYVIEEAYGEVYSFDHYNFSLLRGAAHDSFCEKKAKEYALEAFAHWVLTNADIVAGEGNV